jgi:hypothetical protein
VRSGCDDPSRSTGSARHYVHGRQRAASVVHRSESALRVIGARFAFTEMLRLVQRPIVLAILPLDAISNGPDLALYCPFANLVRRSHEALHGAESRRGPTEGVAATAEVAATRTATSATSVLDRAIATTVAGSRGAAIGHAVTGTYGRHLREGDSRERKC